MLPKRYLIPTLADMIIESVSHRGLRRLIEEGSGQLIRQDLRTRVLNVIATLSEANDISDLIEKAPRGWRVHRLNRNRGNEWSVSVSGNWRLTFEESGSRIYRLNLEDYH